MVASRRRGKRCCDIRHVLGPQSEGETKQKRKFPLPLPPPIPHTQLKDNKVYPRHILADGDGNQSKGFKIEWATVKEESLYVGSQVSRRAFCGSLSSVLYMGELLILSCNVSSGRTQQGKEFIDAATGEVVSEGNFFVKRIDENGKLVHENWKKRYNLVCLALCLIVQTKGVPCLHSLDVHVRKEGCVVFSGHVMRVLPFPPPIIPYIALMYLASGVCGHYLPWLYDS